MSKDRSIMPTVPSPKWSREVARFLHSKSGAISIEYVALASGVAIGAIIIGVIIMDSLVAPAQSIGAQLTVQPPEPPP